MEKTTSSQELSESSAARRKRSSAASVLRLTPTLPDYPFFSLQRTIGNQAMIQMLEAGAIQPKLRVSQPGDADEMEADRVADQVVASSLPRTVQRKCSCNGSSLCTDCEDEKTGKIHRKVERGPTGDSGADRPSVLKNLGPGEPLDSNSRSFFEPRLGSDFCHVRIHRNAQAAQSAQALNARAFTLGSDVVFGPGEYSPHTSGGQRLLAHELTHVVQQGGGNPGTGAAHASASATQSRTSESSTGEETVQRQLDPLGLSPGALLGKAWLNLNPKIKALAIDKAIDAALNAIEAFPGKVVVGEAWTFLKEGLLGFYGKLKSAAEEVKIRVIDKIASIMAGTDDKFSLAFLKGLLKGFFVDGALGIFIAIWDLIKGLKSLWDFLKGIGESIGGFPDEMREWLQRAQNFGQELVSGFGAAIDQLKAAVLDPKQSGSFITAMVEKGRGLARQAGGKIADSLLSFFSNPEASAEIGETAGDIMGMVLWEVVFAVVTAGTGAAVTAIKEAAAGLGKLVARIVTGILKVVEEIRLLLGKVVEIVKGAVKFVKGKLSELGGKLGKLLEEVGEFFAKLLGNCHESKLTCKFRAKLASFVRRIGGTRGLIHSFDSHAAQWFGRAVNRGTHLSEWQALVERAAQSGKVFEWDLEGAETVAHLANFEGKPFVVQFFRAGPRAGELATAFVPNQGQLAAMLERMGI